MTSKTEQRLRRTWVRHVAVASAVVVVAAGWIIPATSAGADVVVASGFTCPTGVALALDGSALVNDNSCNFGGTVRKVASDGSVTAFATYPNSSNGIAVDPAGNVYVGDLRANVFRYSPDGTSGVFVGGMPAGIFGLAVDQAGNIFAADDNDAIDEMSADGATVTRIASGDGFRTVAIDPGTQDVIAGTINGGIYRIPQGGSATKIATDSGGQNYAGISVDPGGFIFTIGGSGCGGRIHRYSPDGSGETTLSSGLCFPSGIAVSAQDTIYYVANGQLNVNRFSVTTTSLPDATIGSAYGPVQLTAGPLGASTPPDVTTVKWKKGVVTVGKALPKGLHLSPTGVLSGTPSAKLAPGTYSVTVKATEKMIQVVAGHKVKTKVSATATIPIVIH